VCMCSNFSFLQGSPCNMSLYCAAECNIILFPFAKKKISDTLRCRAGPDFDFTRLWAGTACVPYFLAHRLLLGWITKLSRYLAR
jgi:hypothetical protein